MALNAIRDTGIVSDQPKIIRYPGEIDVDREYALSDIMGADMNEKQQMVRTLEEVSMNAWPASENILYDGWVLRCAGGYTRRANSIYPLYPSTYDIASKIEHCRQVYEASGLVPVYKLTRYVYPADLDTVLDNHGYRREALTSVQTLPLDAYDAEDDRRVTLSEHADANWVRRFIAMNTVSIRYSSIITNMLQRIATPKCFASFEHDAAIIACGIGVVADHMVGLFDIVVDPRHRQKGLGTRLVHRILKWARCQRATLAYLQVMRDNIAAVSMYNKIGFSEAYQYWYRVG